MGTTLATIPTIITTAIGNFLSGLGSAVVDFFQKLFMVNTGTDASPVWELTTFAYVSFVLMAIGLAIALSSLIFHIVQRHKAG